MRKLEFKIVPSKHTETTELLKIQKKLKLSLHKTELVKAVSTQAELKQQDAANAPLTHPLVL